MDEERSTGNAATRGNCPHSNFKAESPRKRMDQKRIRYPSLGAANLPEESLSLQPRPPRDWSGAGPDLQDSDRTTEPGSRRREHELLLPVHQLMNKSMLEPAPDGDIDSSLRPSPRMPREQVSQASKLEPTEPAESPRTYSTEPAESPRTYSAAPRNISNPTGSWDVPTKVPSIVNLDPPTDRFANICGLVS